MEHLHVFFFAWSNYICTYWTKLFSTFTQMLLEIHSPKVKNIPAPN